MPPRDIIANRDENPVYHVNCILPSDERARFAIGYIFLSCFERYMQVSA